MSAWRNRPVRMSVEPVPESTPTFTLGRQIAAARKHMGEVRWAELMAEWEKR